MRIVDIFYYFKVRTQQINMYDLQVAFKLIEFLVSINIQLIICLLAIVLNCLVLLGTHDLKVSISSVKEEPIKMYTYMQWNAAFNIVYCLLFMFSPLTVCIDSIGIFCSDVRMSQLTQYYKVIGLSYLGTIAKMCSNFTAMAISVDTFVSNGSDRKCWRRLVNISPKKMIAAFIMVACLISGVKIFEFRVNPHYYILGFPNEVSDSNTPELTEMLYYQNDYTDSDGYKSFFSVKISSEMMILMQVLLLLAYFTNDFLILFINMIVDIFLWINVKTYLQKSLVRFLNLKFQGISVTYINRHDL